MKKVAKERVISKSKKTGKFVSKKFTEDNPDKVNELIVRSRLCRRNSII